MSGSRTHKVLALSFGRVFTTFTALASGMVMARILSQTDLATYRQTMLAYDVAIPLLSLGIDSGLYYFLPTEKNRARGLVLDGLLLMLAMGMLYTVFIALGGNHLLAKRFSNPAIVATLAYLVPLPLIMLPAKLVSSVLVVQNQVSRLTFYNVWSGLLLAVGIMAACLFWKSPESMVLTRVAISVATGLVAIGLILRAVPADSWRPSLASMRRMITYSIPLVGASALGSIHLQLDKLIVSSMCPPEQFAVYSNGAIEIPLIGIVTASISTIILPDMRKMIAAGDRPGAIGLFRQAASKSAVIIFPVMAFLMASAESFIVTLFSSKYSGSVLPFQIYLLLLPVRIVNYGAILMALGKTRTILNRSCAGLVANLFLSILLVRWFGFIGAIVSTVICIYLVNCAWNFAAISDAVGCRWWQVLPFGELGRLAWPSAAAAVPVFALRSWLAGYPAIVQLSVNVAVFAAALAGLVWLFRIAPFQAEAGRVYRMLQNRLRARPEATV